MRMIKPPENIPDQTHPSVFLAGSIEMDIAEKWQDRVTYMLKDTEWTIFNPRRDSWNSDWKQEKENYEFYNQVNWELDGLEQAHKVILYFDPKTKSPISLLELGLFGTKPNKMIVVCPEGFWRKGNIDIICERYKIHQAKTLEEAVLWIQQ